MQIETQAFLEMVEAGNKIAFYDCEATGLRGDYNSILVGSIKPFGKRPYSFVVDRPGNDKSIIGDIRDALSEYEVVTTFYGKMFDFPLLQTRLLHHNMKPLDSIHHLDYYFAAKAHLLTARKSQAHLLRFFGTPQQKMDVSPEEWNRVLSNPKRGLDIMRQRCESDVIGLEALYKKIRHLVKEVKLDS